MRNTVLVLVMMLVAGALAVADGQPESGYGTGAGGGRYGNGGGYGVGAGPGGAGFGGVEPDIRFSQDMATLIAESADGPLSEDEEKGMLGMIEEEKLARDVYLALHEVWNLPIFASIAQSEQKHMDAIGLLLEKYGIEGSPVSLEPGEFSDPAMQQLYDDLLEEGRGSLVDALGVGGTIEDLDISDLQREIAASDNDDIRLVYQNLMKGSRNHLRSFIRQLDRAGADYEAQFIDDSYLEQILAISREVATITTPEYQL